MSSGTQVDLDWAGIGSAASGAGVPLAPKNEGPAAGDATNARYLTDEEILGIDPHMGNGDGERNDAETSPDAVARLFRGGESSRDGANGSADERVSTDAGNPGSKDPGYSNAAAAEMPAWMAAAAGDPRHSAEAQALWREHQEFRAAFASPEEARAVKELLPGGLRDALSLREATQSIERIDAALFSGDARAQADVVAEIACANPAAFRALFAEAAKVLAGSEIDNMEPRGTPAGGREARRFDGSASGDLSAGPTLRTNREGWGTRKPEAGGTETGSSHSSSSVILSEARLPDGQVKNPSDGFASGAENRQRDSSGKNRPQNDSSVERAENLNPGSKDSSFQPPASNLQDTTSHQSVVTSHSFDPAAYAAFERATNDAVARDVRGSIHDALARVLPEGVAEGAARRIGEDIFHEVHRALAADRSLSEQVAGVLRERRFGTGEQQRVASLLAGRARQMVPGVARRVIGEWTSTVLSTARTKAARQAAAAARVDIASPGGSLDSTPMRSRAAGSREVDYTAMSDEQILNS